MILVQAFDKNWSLPAVRSKAVREGEREKPPGTEKMWRFSTLAAERPRAKLSLGERTHQPFGVRFFFGLNLRFPSQITRSIDFP